MSPYPRNGPRRRIATTRYIFKLECGHDVIRSAKPASGECCCPECIENPNEEERARR